MKSIRATAKLLVIVIPAVPKITAADPQVVGLELHLAIEVLNRVGSCLDCGWAIVAGFLWLGGWRWLARRRSRWQASLRRSHPHAAEHGQSQQQRQRFQHTTLNRRDIARVSHDPAHFIEKSKTTELLGTIPRAQPPSSGQFGRQLLLRVRYDPLQGLDRFRRRFSPVFYFSPSSGPSFCGYSTTRTWSGPPP